MLARGAKSNLRRPLLYYTCMYLITYLLCVVNVMYNVYAAGRGAGIICFTDCSISLGGIVSLEWAKYYIYRVRWVDVSIMKISN